MRITRESLFEAANNSAARLAERDHSVLCIYLTGSVLDAQYLLGNTTDIDLICVHGGKKQVLPREVKRISDEVTLDIAHVSDIPFQEPRNLRREVWLGSFLWKGVKVLYDCGHWFEFIQAGATAQFMSPGNVLFRARSLATRARGLWLSLDEHSPSVLNLDHLLDYFQILEDCGNAVACLNGTPLALRRFWLQLPQRAIDAGAPELAGSLQRLVATEIPDDETWQAWFNPWVGLLDEAVKQAKCPVEFLPCRRRYYTEGVAWLRVENPLAALWILLRTGLKASRVLRSNSSTQKQLLKITADLGFSAEGFPEKLKGLDQWLDSLESLLDGIENRQG
jgi:hypothetical protein